MKEIKKSTLFYCEGVLSGCRSRLFENLLNLVGNIIPIAYILILGCKINGFIETIFLLGSFITIKRIIGGLHFDSRRKCIIYTIAVFTAAIIIQHYLGFLMAIGIIFVSDFTLISILRLK